LTQQWREEILAWYDETHESKNAESETVAVDRSNKRNPGKAATKRRTKKNITLNVAQFEKEMEVRDKHPDSDQKILSFHDVMKEQSKGHGSKHVKGMPQDTWTKRKELHEHELKEQREISLANTAQSPALRRQINLLLIDIDIIDHYFPLLQKLTDHFIVISSFRIYRTYIKRNWSRSLRELRKCLEERGNWVFLHDEFLYYNEEFYTTTQNDDTTPNSGTTQSSTSKQITSRDRSYAIRGRFSIAGGKHSDLACLHRDESFTMSWEPLVDFIQVHILHDCDCQFIILTQQNEEESTTTPAPATVHTHPDSHTETTPSQNHFLSSTNAQHVNIKNFIENLYSSLTAEYEELHATLDKDQRLGKVLFQPHLSLQAVRLQASDLHFATLHISEKTSKLGWIKVIHKDILTRIVIRGSDNLNRALHGDVVAVRITSKGTEGQPWEGNVVSVLQRNWRDYVACIQEADLDETGTKLAPTTGSNILLVPFSKRIPKIRVQTNQGDSYVNQRLMVRVADWSRNSKYPSGHIIRAIGPMGNIDTEVESLMIEHDLHQAVDRYTPEAEAELPSADYVIPPEEIARRRDLRESHFVCSIDPIGCEDIDDALSVRRLNNGMLEIGVHIADVTFFMRHGSNFDMEARKRATSIYLVDRRIDMIPSVLSADLCSLHEKQDRLAVSVLWTMDETGSVKDVWFGRTVIRSRYALHYKQAHNIIHDIKEPPVQYDRNPRWKEAVINPKEHNDLKRSLTLLQNVARIFREERFRHGALSLADSEVVNFRLDKHKKPTSFSPPEDLEIHHTIEEWMVQANHYVAKKIYDEFKQNALIRVHPSPQMAQLEIVRKAAEARGEVLRTNSPTALAESLRQCASKNPELQYVIKALITKCMQEAVYASTGSISKEQFAHAGLGLDYYTHFTSPIRRYADVLVHRMLLRAIGETSEDLLDNKQLNGVCEHMNHVTRSSKHLQMDSSKWFRAIYFQEHAHHTIAQAVIENVYEDRIHVLVPKYRISSAIFFSTKDDKLIVPSKHEKVISEDDPFETVLTSDTSVTLRVPLLNREYKFSVFDHVDVKIGVRESRAHLPSLELTLQSYDVSQKRRKREVAPAPTEEEEPSEKPLNKDESLTGRFKWDSEAVERALLMHAQPEESRLVVDFEDDANAQFQVELLNESVTSGDHTSTKVFAKDAELNRLRRKRAVIQARLASHSNLSDSKRQIYEQRLHLVERKTQHLQQRYAWRGIQEIE